MGKTTSNQERTSKERSTSGNQQNLHYQYDSAGNITVITDNLLGGTAGSAFEYDDLNRLMTASGTSGTKLAVLTR